MNKLNLFVILTIIAAAAMFAAMVTPALSEVVIKIDGIQVFWNGTDYEQVITPSWVNIN